MRRNPARSKDLLADSRHDINRYMRSVTWLALASLVVLAGCEDTELQGAKAEVKKVEANLDLPAVPNFDLPPQGNPHNVREMRLLGRNLLDTEVDVKAYILWIYDCKEHGGPKGPIGEPGMSDKDKEKIIEADMSLCWKPHFIIGDTPDTAPGLGIEVVEVPRPMLPVELKKFRRKPKAVRDATPKPPEIKVGDLVVVNGTWAKRSPAGFANSTGLIVYHYLCHDGQPCEPPPPMPEGAGGGGGPLP